MNHYPSRRYHPEVGDKLVHSEQEDAELVGWYHSPADFGVETCPGLVPDPVIAANKISSEKPKKAGRPAKPKEGERA